MFRVYTQLKDGRGKDEYVYIYFIKIGSLDKKRSIKCQSIYFNSDGGAFQSLVSLQSNITFKKNGD